MTIAFTVRDPVSTNRAYGRRGGTFGGRGLYMTAAGRAFKARVREAALFARARHGWPDPGRVATARVSYQLFDYAGDTDGVRKLLKDALQGVLYGNDRDVSDGPADLPIRDGQGRRVEVVVELLTVRTAAEAAAREALALRRLAKRTSRRTPGGR